MQQLNFFEHEARPSLINVAQVKQISPFRYPGGKTWLVPQFCQWVSSLPTNPRYLIEPFAGGGIISLSAAYKNLVEKCIMIEKDEEVAAVWKTVIYDDWRWLADRILRFNLTPDNAREIIEKHPMSTKEAAFRTILKNRISHGGILANGSGFIKSGEKGKGIKSRWYPETLSKRIEAIAQMKDKLEFHEGDALDYILQYSECNDTIFFVDPPYTASKKNAGKRLYRYFNVDHNKLFNILGTVNSPFMLTYDYDENIINMAKSHGFQFEKIPMTGTHNLLKHELIITK